MHTHCIRWYHSRVFQPDLMAGDSSSGSGHARDEAQGMEVLKAGLLTQETALRALAKNVDHRFHNWCQQG